MSHDWRWQMPVARIIQASHFSLKKAQYYSDYNICGALADLHHA
jgi:hypothetical protein